MKNVAFTRSAEKGGKGVSDNKNGNPQTTEKRMESEPKPVIRKRVFCPKKCDRLVNGW